MNRQDAGRIGRRAGLAGLLLAVVPASPALAAGTPAGTEIVNVAQLSWIEGKDQRSTSSNVASFKVDEVIDVTVSPLTDIVPVAPGDQGRVLAFRVTNSGNGREAYALAADLALAGDQYDGQFVRLAIDTNNDGQYDPLVDAAYQPGVNDPDLAADASVTVFVISNVPGTVVDGDRTLQALAATARTGSGTPGTAFPGAGTAGADAVVGLTRATASARAAQQVSAVVPELIKAQTIAGPNGETAAVPGAIITYTLTARYSGSLAATGARISDPIPAGTTYVPASLSLNGTVLTDAAGDDAGDASAAGISVLLGTLASGAAPVVRFQVRVNAN